MKKNIITGIIYFLAGVASVELLTFGFELMNKQSTVSFWLGLLISGTTLTFIGATFYNLISKLIKNQSK